MLVSVTHQAHDGSDKPHIHLFDTVNDMDIRSPFYSVDEMMDFLYNNNLFNVHHMQGFGKGVPLY